MFFYIYYLIGFCVIPLIALSSLATIFLCSSVDTTFRIIFLFLVYFNHDCFIDLWEQTRPAVLSAFKMVDLTGKGGIVSQVSPGVFLQVYLLHLKLSAFSLVFRK